MAACNTQATVFPFFNSASEDWIPLLLLKARFPCVGMREDSTDKPVVQREQTVHVELVKQKKHWRIVSLSPLDFFTPAKFSLAK